MKPRIIRPSEEHEELDIRGVTPHAARIRVRSLMDGRRFLHEIVKLYADGSD